MSSIFVSHSGEDGADTQRVLDQLKTAGFASLFVDFDPENGIPPGRNWERELYVQLTKADAVVFLASEASVVSHWCTTEISMARQLKRPVFPVRLQPGAQLALLQDVQWIDATNAPDLGVERLVNAMKRSGIDPADAFAWDPERSPFPGLKAFTAKDAAVFFGRDEQVTQLLEALHPLVTPARGRFVAIVGPSGSGKSSLLHAGLLPRLAKQPEQWLVLPSLVPGRTPIRNLARCLSQAFGDNGRLRSPDEMDDVLGHGPDALVGIARELAELPTNSHTTRRLLIVVDQAEELVTASGEREQRAFLALLTGALTVDSPVWAIATVRSEFLSSAPERAGLADAIDDPLLIEPLGRERLAEVIVRPAQRAGLEFDPGLVERMVDDTTGGDALPLLAHTLHELTERAGRDGQVSTADYERVGGVIGALRYRADRLMKELARSGHGELVVPTLLELTTVTGREEPTRRRVPRAALSAEQQIVVDAFIDARLVISDGESGDSAHANVAVAHEALLRQWQPLREAIEADRSGLKLRSDVERLAADWAQDGHDDSYLLRGARLAVVEDWAGRHSGQIGTLERQFLEASRLLAARELLAARRTNRRLRLLAVTLAGLLLAAMMTGWQAYQENRQSRLALSRQLIAQADRLIDTQPDTAILASLQSMSIARAAPAYPPTALITGLTRPTRTARLFSCLDGSPSVSPDAHLVACAGDDNTVRMWSTANGEPYGNPLIGTWVLFSPSGALAATIDHDTLRLWDTATGRTRGETITETVRLAEFSPDGTLLAVAAKENEQETTVRLWDTATGQAHGSALTGRTTDIDQLDFSPNGALLAIEDGGAVRLWDTAAGRPHGQPLAGELRSWASTGNTAFSPDGTLLATAEGGNTVRLWNTGTGQPHGPPLIHPDRVVSIVFSPRGSVLATTMNNTVRLWDTATGHPRSESLGGHTGPLYEAVFSPDGALLATAAGIGDEDNTVRLWDSATGQPHGPPLAGHTAGVTEVNFSPDGTVLASASNDNTVRLWNTADGQPVGGPLLGHTESVTTVDFSSDGKDIVTVSKDGTIRSWQVAETRALGRAVSEDNALFAQLEFSRDGATLATASRDAVQLLDTSTGAPHGPPISVDDVNETAFSPRGDLLATASQQGVQLWDTATGNAHSPPLGDPNIGARHVEFSPDGTLLAAARENTVQLWDAATGQPHGERLAGQLEARYTQSTTAFIGDGALLATVGDEYRLQLWDTATGVPRVLGDPNDKSAMGNVFASSVEASPNGALLAIGNGTSVQLWNVDSGKAAGRPFGAADFVDDVAFSSNSAVLAVADKNMVQLWDTATGQRLGRPLTDRDADVVSVAFSPAGALLATADEDGRVLLWDFRQESLIRAGCGLVGRNLSSVEWDQLLSGIPYERTCADLPPGPGAPASAPAAQYAA